ncbi:MAG: hypothetical protein ACRELW_21885, partial [Candidatus Rokuibacteriota bacterium]
MDHSQPRSLSWTSLFVLTLLAALAETAILFPSTVVPTTRFAAALPWDASAPGLPSPEPSAEETPTPEMAPPPAPAPA